MTKLSNKQQLFIAIESNDIFTASSLISSGGLNLNAKPWPLHKAAEHGHLEIMTLLLDAGANIDRCDNNRYTACHSAIDHNQFDALKLLVERGANLNAKSESLLMFASHNRESDQILIYLLDVGVSLDNLKRRELMTLVVSVAVYGRLLARGVSFDSMRVDEFGCTLCHHVARNVTDENDFRFLVDVCGTHSVNAVNDVGETPLHWTAQHQNSAAMRVLVELGANVDQQDRRGWTALHIATGRPQSASSSCSKLLLAVGADVHLVTSRGQTACHIAATNRNVAALWTCVAAGGDLDQLDHDNNVSRKVAIDGEVALPTADEIGAARRDIAKTRLDLVRHRAVEICIGLQQLDLNALQLCEILTHSFGAIGSVIAFHQWWAIATKVKHFHDRNKV